MVVSDKDIATIARDLLTDWESLQPYLGLSRAQKVDIRKSYPGEYGKQKHECLEVWKETKGNEATYGAFITAAEEAKDQQLADRVRAMLTTSATIEEGNGEQHVHCVCVSCLNCSCMQHAIYM